MKTIIILLAVLLAMSKGYTQEIKWYSWDEGYKLAKKENKPMLVFVYASWCNQCKRMLEKTFVKSDVITKTQSDFIAIKFDIDIATTEIDGTRKLNLDQFSESEFLKKIIGGPQLGIPRTVLFNPAKDKRIAMDGIQDSEELTIVMKDFML